MSERILLSQSWIMRLAFCMCASVLVLNPALFSQVRLEVFADGFTRPVTISNAGDSRLFVVEQEGRIIVLDSAGNRNPDPFLDIVQKVTSAGNEQGLLGLAFHPDHVDNGFFYVNYTDVDGNTMISRFSVSASDPDRADPESEFPVLSFEQPFVNHNGGDLKFGPDGYLYISTGDGGSGGDPGNRAQDRSILLGKILRIDVDGGNPYAIPEDNPFLGDDSALDEVWALGLRNPWRISFDRLTGDLWIADVGQNEIEEINYQPASSPGGENYGWRCYEGSQPYNTGDCQGKDAYVFPIYEYSHNPGGFCSVTGGYVYRGKAYPSIEGHYFFADFCSNHIWSIKNSSGNWIVSDHGPFPDNTFSTFGEDMDGELYVASLSGGAVYRIVAGGATFLLPESEGPRVWVYPNPATDHLYIETEQDPQALGTRTLPGCIELYSLEGKVLISKNFNENPVRMNIEHLSPGIYFLGIKFRSPAKFCRVVKY